MIYEKADAKVVLLENEDDVVTSSANCAGGNGIGNGNGAHNGQGAGGNGHEHKDNDK